MKLASYLDRTPHGATNQRRVVIVGGGFGGLECAKALSGADIHVIWVDQRRTNSSINLGKSCPSESAIGRTGHDHGALV
jgi:predicted NAD/FAD-dependent oxidoreductase